MKDNCTVTLNRLFQPIPFNPDTMSATNAASLGLTKNGHTWELKGTMIQSGQWILWDGVKHHVIGRNVFDMVCGPDTEP